MKLKKIFSFFFDLLQKNDWVKMIGEDNEEEFR